MAPVILELRKRPLDFDVTVCSTGQHTTMLDDALSVFDIQPDVKFEVMHPGQSLAQLTSRLLLALDTYFEEKQPDLVLVHGDTTSAMAGALAAFYRNIKVGHVEAGLRTQNLLSPFPEEYNRRSITIAARYNFAPTLAAQSNLEREGVSPKNIIITGNTVIDALQFTIRTLLGESKQVQELKDNLLQKLGFDPELQDFILITAHRRENFGVGLDNICESICELAKTNRELYFVYPVHLNPRVKNTVESRLSKISNVVLLDPQDYQSFAWLLYNCLLVLTDSGGIQEEAPSLGKPVLVMRKTSERPEAIKAGTAKLVTTESNRIVREVQLLISDAIEYNKMSHSVNPFGDGKAAPRILEYLLKRENF
jgi:UDP-N-acetylglucosamine 2-epimerase (non-hydrolysing)